MSHVTFIGVINNADPTNGAYLLNGFWLPIEDTGFPISVNFPLISSLTELNKWFWQSKNWQFKVNIQYSYNATDPDTGFIYTESGSFIVDATSVVFQAGSPGVVVDDELDLPISSGVGMSPTPVGGYTQTLTTPDGTTTNTGTITGEATISCFGHIAKDGSGNYYTTISLEVIVEADDSYVITSPWTWNSNRTGIATQLTFDFDGHTIGVDTVDYAPIIPGSSIDFSHQEATMEPIDSWSYT